MLKCLTKFKEVTFLHMKRPQIDCIDKAQEAVQRAKGHLFKSLMHRSIYV